MQVVFVLVVGGVCFEYDVWLFFQEIGQCVGSCGVVFVYVVVVEVYVWLYYYCDYVLLCIVQLWGIEGLLVDGQGLCGGGWCGYLQVFGQ